MQTAIQNPIIDLLRNRLARIQSQRHSYSLRAFARDLAIPAPVLSEILRGKRTITEKMAKKVCQGLALTSVETKNIIDSFQARRNQVEHLFVQLGQDQFNLVSDWYFFAILSLVETEDFQSDEKWISKRLGIKTSETKIAIETLIRLKLIKKVRGKFTVSGERLATSNDVPSQAIQKNHLQGLDLARQALIYLPVEEREFSANTLAIDASRLPEFKEELRNLRRKYANQMNRGRKTEVFRLQMQLFPLTKGVKSEN